MRRSIQEQILLELRQIRYRLEDIERLQSQRAMPQKVVSESELLRLPDHLRRSYVAVSQRGECDATQVSRDTGRVRAIESHYLNDLVNNGWLHKRRESKTALFSLVKRPALANQS